MGIFDALRRGGPVAQARALTAQQIFETTDGSAPSFYDVSGDSALRIVAVFAATSLIADMIAGLPIKTYRRERLDAAPVLIDPPRWLDQPDDRISDFDFWHQALTATLLRGNAVGLVFRDRAGDPLSAVREVEWQHPSWVSIDDTSGWLPTYRVRGSVPLYSERTRPGGGIVHVPGYVRPGSVVGLSPVTNFRHTFETARNAAQTAHDYYGERGLPSGVLSSKTKLKPGEATAAKETISAELAPGSTLVLDGTNWVWEQVSLSPADMAFLDAIEATANQVAAIYRVEPEDVAGKQTSSLKYTTVEGNQRKLTLRTLLSWARRFEQGMRPLLDRPSTDFMRFDFDELTRPDALTREKVTTERLMNGTQTLGEARADRNLPMLTAEELSNWLAWFRTNKGAQAETVPLVDLLTQLTKGGD